MLDPSSSSRDVAATPRADRRPVRLAALLFLGYAALIGQFQGIQVILIPATVERLAPAAKVSTLALLGTLSAAATIVAMFVGGWISDRTRSRFGRRTPWLVVSALATCGGSALLAVAQSVPALVVSMSLMWFAANFYQTVLLAVLPDRVRPAHLGFVSAAMALGVPIGIFEGVNIAAHVPAAWIGYVLLATPFAVATALIVLVEREPSSLDISARVEGGAGRGRWLDAFGDRDFTLAFASRFVLFLAYFTVVGYLLYIMQDYVGTARLPHGDAAAAVGTMLSLTTIAWLLVTPLTGVLSDRIGHTAGIVGAVSLLIGAAMLLPAVSSGWTAMRLFGVAMGLTFGIYFAIDLKLVSMVLPRADTAGRDMGLMAIAASGPTILAPAFAAAIIRFASFPVLFATGAALAVLGGLLAFPIRARSTLNRHA